MSNLVSRHSMVGAWIARQEILEYLNKRGQSARVRLKFVGLLMINQSHEFQSYPLQSKNHGRRIEIFTYSNSLARLQPVHEGVVGEFRDLPIELTLFRADGPVTHSTRETCGPRQHRQPLFQQPAEVSVCPNAAASSPTTTSRTGPDGRRQASRRVPPRSIAQRRRHRTIRC